MLLFSDRMRPLWVKEKDILSNRRLLDNILKYIANGKVVVCGTDTVYGLCANALDEEVIKKVYSIKKRDISKEMSIFLSDKSEIEKYAYINDIGKILIDAYMPGPITIILKKKDILPNMLSKDYIGIRIPESKTVQLLSKIPITATSANISGKKSPKSPDELDDELLENVDIVIDCGVCKYQVPSTIVKVYDDGKLKLIREGTIPFSEILKTVGSN